MINRRQFFMAALILLSTHVFGFAQVKRDSEACTKAAWDAYNAEAFEDALHIARECAEEHQSGADVLQDALKKKGVEPPDLIEINGRLQNDSVPGKEKEALKKELLSRGPLNDVPTCFWILGRSLQKLHNDKDALVAYNEAKQYDYGLTWDDGGFFWSAARDAAARARRLEASTK